jgi:hypothetical protein
MKTGSALGMWFGERQLVSATNLFQTNAGINELAINTTHQSGSSEPAQDHYPAQPQTSSTAMQPVPRSWVAPLQWQIHRRAPALALLGALSS